MKTRVITALDGKTATATSGKFYVGDAERIGLLFRRAAHASGNTVFTVNIGGEAEGTVTPVMTATNMLIKDIVADAGAGTSGEDIGHTRVASVTLAGNGDEMVWLDPVCLVTYLSVTATETTDGTHTAFIIAQYRT